MKKIMFNDRFGLTQAVLEGIKTMTRRMVQKKYLLIYEDMSRLGKPCYPMEEWLIRRAAPYKIGEEVAVAQAYKDIVWHTNLNAPLLPVDRKELFDMAGKNNKMFVRADLMPHHIRITDIKVERLQDISDADSRKEGVIPVTWRQYLKQDWDDLSPQKYIDHDVWTLPIFKEGILDPWAESHPDEFMADSPSTAFNVLIRKMMGVKKWESNPWVFAYTFELID